MYLDHFINLKYNYITVDEALLYYFFKLIL